MPFVTLSSALTPHFARYPTLLVSSHPSYSMSTLRS